MDNLFQESFNKLVGYCEKEEFKGYDPYDGLTSSFFQSLTFLSRHHLPRLIWIQIFKRSPINLRPMVGIKKSHNPKGLSLFLSGYCTLYKSDSKKEYLDKIHFFINKINEKAIPGFSGACWGYNFDWEATVFSQPINTPTIVVSSFIANSLLDAYEILRDEKLLMTARSTCDFILKDLNRSYENNGNYAFSYSQLDKSIIFNASLLGCRLLSRVYSFTGEGNLINEAKKVVNYCCDSQREDGSWTYGKEYFQQWVDNFHTGFNLECISDYMKLTGDYSFKKNLQNGFDYYIKTFFTNEGIPKYYNNSTYPIDIHSPAQLVITLSKLDKFQEKRKLIDKVLMWTINNMQSRKGFFYYQINKCFSSKIPYMRWSQAWMFYALSMYLFQTCNTNQANK
jgi:hypothetical protein